MNLPPIRFMQTGFKAQTQERPPEGSLSDRQVQPKRMPLYR